MRSGSFEISQGTSGLLIPNDPQNHITSTNFFLYRVQYNDMHGRFK